MKRKLRRVTGIIIGVVLGWWVAGAAFSEGSAPSAHAPTTAVAPPPDAQTAGRTENHAAEHAVHALAPGHRVPWLAPVLLGAAGLFIAAVAIGIPALKLRGPLPPDPADHFDDHHADAADQHGHVGDSKAAGH